MTPATRRGLAYALLAASLCVVVFFFGEQMGKNTRIAHRAATSSHDALHSSRRNHGLLEKAVKLLRAVKLSRRRETILFRRSGVSTKNLPHGTPAQPSPSPSPQESPTPQPSSSHGGSHGHPHPHPSSSPSARPSPRPTCLPRPVNRVCLP